MLLFHVQYREGLLTIFLDWYQVAVCCFSFGAGVDWLCVCSKNKSHQLRSRRAQKSKKNKAEKTDREREKFYQL